jgi:hypothetical protein
MSGTFWFPWAFFGTIFTFYLLRTICSIETFMAQAHTFQTYTLIGTIAWALSNRACMLFNEFLCVFTSITSEFTDTFAFAIFVHTVILTVAWTDTIYIKGGNLSNFAITGNIITTSKINSFI